MGLPGSECGAGSRPSFTLWPCTPPWTTCNMPTLSPHQPSRTALETRAPNMFPKPLGLNSHLQFTALHLDVPALSCTPAKLANNPVSFQAITRPRLHCLTPAQFPRVPHHQGCNVKSRGTLLHFCRVFRPIRQRSGVHSHAKVGQHGRSCEFQLQAPPPPGLTCAVSLHKSAHQGRGAQRAWVGCTRMGCHVTSVRARETAP